jgi:hypothetical protein
MVTRYNANTLALRRMPGAFALALLLTISIARADVTTAWLQAIPGQTALVGAAPWPMTDPEAALTSTEPSAAVNPDDSSTRPADAIHQPIGLRVTIEQVYLDGVALVRPEGAAWTAYTRLDQLVPEVPAGTRLVVAGGFGNAAAFYPKLDTPQAGVEEIATGTAIVVLGMGIAPYDPDGTGFVRVKVVVESAPQRGRTGWIPVGFTGLPDPAGTPGWTAERACRCRLLEFR